jgi:antitoxin (DNA-binding transcriptional repressor) of toxin-antitoxin stability system
MMLTKSVDIHEAQKQLVELLSSIAAGTEIILTQDNTPVARLTSLPHANAPRMAGLHAGAFWVSDDFDEPLPDSVWVGNA